MASVHKKQKATALRKKGLSYGKISKEIGVPKSTLSYWLKNVSVPKEYHNRLYTKRLMSLLRENKEFVRNNQKERRERVMRSQNKITELSNKSFIIAGTVMYWAEGSKTRNTSITNSDPRIIVFMVKWFEEVFQIPPTRLQAHLHIHGNDSDEKIKRYWSRLTGIPLCNFGKSFVKPKGTGHRKNILENGIIRIRVTGKGSQEMREQILAWIDKIDTLLKTRV